MLEDQWLQLDLGPPTLITGLVTRGRGDKKVEGLKFQDSMMLLIKLIHLGYLLLYMYSDEVDRNEVCQVPVCIPIGFDLKTH